MMNLKARYLNEDEWDLWDRFVDECGYGTIYHKSYWNKAIFQIEQSASLSIIGCFRDQELIAGIITGRKKKFGFIHTMVPPYASCYYGLLLKERKSEHATKRETYRKEVLEFLLGFIEGEFQIITFSLPPEIKDIRSFNWKKYTARVFYTYRDSLEHPEELFEGFLPDIRRRIKKGEKLEFIIRDTSLPDDIHHAYRLINASHRRQDHPFRFRIEQFEAFLQLPELKDHFKIYTIWMGNTPVATIVLLIDGKIAYDWISGADPLHYQSGLNQVLFWKVLQKLHDSGVGIFDFFGANTFSISKYKSAFNFELVPYYRVSKESGILARILMGIKRSLKG